MKKIVQNFNNFVSKTIFKVQNKTNSNLKKSNIKISNFSKYFIILFTSVFVYLFYLLVPLLYDKNWVQNTIENKLINEFKINLSSSADIIYRILPAPHFAIKDSKILVNEIKESKSIAEIKDLKIFLSQKNFFDKEKMNIKKVVIKDANFSLIRNDLKMIDEFSNENFSDKRIKVSNSKIFFKDNLDQIITIIKIKKAHLFFDNEKLINFFELQGEIFAIPFIFDFSSQNESKILREINFKAKSLKLNISNQSIKDKISYHILDTSTLAIEHLMPCGLKSMSLVNIRKALGIETGKAHTALADTLACVEVYRQLARASWWDRFVWKRRLSQK